MAKEFDMWCNQRLEDSLKSNGLIKDLVDAIGDRDILRVTLLSKATEIAKKPPSIQYNVLSMALMGGDLFVLDTLMMAGIDPDARQATGRTHLMSLVNYNNAPLVSWILDKGADVNAKDDRGLTALHIAAQGGQLPIVQLLVEHGADYSENNVDQNGLTPYSWARREGGADIMDYLDSLVSEN